MWCRMFISIHYDFKVIQKIFMYLPKIELDVYIELDVWRTSSKWKVPTWATCSEQARMMVCHHEINHDDDVAINMPMIEMTCNIADAGGDDNDRRVAAHEQLAGKESTVWSQLPSETEAVDSTAAQIKNTEIQISCFTGQLDRRGIWILWPSILQYLQHCKQNVGRKCSFYSKAM